MPAFRFNEEQDKELMRELALKRPFAAELGTIMNVWEDVAASVSAAIGSQINHKQARNRLKVLNNKFKCGEIKSARASGVEESLDATDVLSHYDDLLGLIREYLQLEDDHAQEKSAAQSKKKRKEIDLVQSAADIMAESNRRRAERHTAVNDMISLSCSSQEDNASGESESDKAVMPSKRPSLFALETERQRQEIAMRKNDLALQQQQFEERLAFDREQAASRLTFERQQSADRVRAEQQAQQLNRQLILECAKLFADAVANQSHKTT